MQICSANIAPSSAAKFLSLMQEAVLVASSSEKVFELENCAAISSGFAEPSPSDDKDKLFYKI